MKNFFLKVMKMRFPWNVWVLLLGGVNVVGGLLFLSTFEGKFALIGITGAIIVMLAIHSKYGFVRLLGLGHILFWVPFVIWNLARLSEPSSLNSEFKIWLITVSVLNSLSLLLDFADVIRFFKGEKSEMP